MLQYAICQIKGKQYKVLPNQPFEVDKLGILDKSINVKTLLLVEDGKVKLGKPYLEDLKIEVLGDGQKRKIRVSKYHAKANTRKTKGQRPKITKVVLKKH